MMIILLSAMLLFAATHIVMLIRALERATDDLQLLSQQNVHLRLENAALRAQIENEKTVMREVEEYLDL